jgi:hypothetical protein
LTGIAAVVKSHSSDIAFNHPDRGVNTMSTDIKMLGCSAEALERHFKSQYNINMYVAGLLSDAQELIAMGRTEQANQIINQVKYYFFEFTNTRDEVTV